VRVKDRELRRSAANWAANYLTPRNIGRYLGYSVMEAAVGLFRARQLRVADLTAVVSDRLVADGATVIDVGASWRLFSYHLACRVG
jgi:hypothetical protein